MIRTLTSVAKTTICSFIGLGCPSGAEKSSRRLSGGSLIQVMLPVPAAPANDLILYYLDQAVLIKVNIDRNSETSFSLHSLWCILVQSRK
jgi:hypothetical protein